MSKPNEEMVKENEVAKDDFENVRESGELVNIGKFEKGGAWGWMTYEDCNYVTLIIDEDSCWIEQPMYKVSKEYAEWLVGDGRRRRPSMNRHLEHPDDPVSPKYKKLYGYWRVTTEGYVKGRNKQHPLTKDSQNLSVRNLGTYEGWVDKIALFLANRAYYSLKFERIGDEKPELVDTAKSVNVQFNIDSGTWDMNPEERAENMRKVFEANGRECRISESNYYNSFVIHSDEYDEEAEKRKKALSKLTEEERKLLGL